MSNSNWIEADRLCQLKHPPKIPQYIRFFHWCCAEIDGGWDPKRNWNITEVQANTVEHRTTAQLVINHPSGGGVYYVVHSLKDVGYALYSEGKSCPSDLLLKIVEESRENRPRV